MTTVSDQLMEYGGVPVGAGRLAKIFQAKNIFFVDGNRGQDGWTAKTPRKAVALPSVAVGLAAKEGIIYVAPKSTIACADVYYSDNIVIPVTKPLVQLIGAGAGTVPGYRGAVQIRPLVDTTHIIDVKSAGVVLENLHINDTGGGTGKSGINADRLGTDSNAVSLQVRHCRFISTVSYSSICGALFLGSNQYCIIEDNIFLSCKRGLLMRATSGSPQSFTVRRNIFCGKVTERDVDLHIAMTDIESKGHIIADNIFADGLPNLAAGLTKRFIWSEGAETAVSTGIISNNFFATNAGTFGTTGNAGIVPAGWFLAGNHSQGGLLART